MSEELNRRTAKKLVSKIATCTYEECHTTLEGVLFTELQIAQKRGEVITIRRLRDESELPAAQSERN